MTSDSKWDPAFSPNLNLLGPQSAASLPRTASSTPTIEQHAGDSKNHRKPAAEPALCGADFETSLTKRAGRVGFSGRLAQLVRAAGLQPAGQGFESLSAHPPWWEGISSTGHPSAPLADLLVLSLQVTAPRHDYGMPGRLETTPCRGGAIP